MHNEIIFYLPYIGEKMFYAGHHNGEQIWTSNSNEALLFDTKEFCNNTLNDVRKDKNPCYIGKMSLI